MNLTKETIPVPLQINSEGVVFVKGTRIPIDTIILEFKLGASPEAIVEQFSTLQLVDVYTVISYYLHHQTEIEAYLEERQQEAQKIREENERRFPAKGLRDRLLARQQQK